MPDVTVPNRAGGATGIKYTYSLIDREPVPRATVKRLQPFKGSVHRPGRQHHMWPGLFKLIGPPTGGNAIEGAVCPSCGEPKDKYTAIMYISGEWVCAECVVHTAEQGTA